MQKGTQRSKRICKKATPFPSASSPVELILGFGLPGRLQMLVAGGAKGPEQSPALGSNLPLYPLPLNLLPCHKAGQFQQSSKLSPLVLPPKVSQDRLCSKAAPRSEKQKPGHQFQTTWDAMRLTLALG